MVNSSNVIQILFMTQWSNKSNHQERLTKLSEKGLVTRNKELLKIHFNASSWIEVSQLLIYDFSLRIVYNISNFFGMESKQSGLLLSQDEKSFISQDHLPPSIPQNNLDDLGHQIQQINAETNIQIKYYQQYKKIYFTSYKLWLEIRKQLKVKEGLTSRLNTIDTQLTNLHKVRRIEEEVEVEEERQNDSKRRNNKRMRRTAEQIVRKYVCTAEFCDRCYGSQGSLQQHIKLKHPELYKKENQSEQF